jgi:mRNA deadenylase 3'-5' endonuclease subunit Ccr4
MYMGAGHSRAKLAQAESMGMSDPANGGSSSSCIRMLKFSNFTHTFRDMTPEM